MAVTDAVADGLTPSAMGPQDAEAASALIAPLATASSKSCWLYMSPGPPCSRAGG